MKTNGKGREVAVKVSNPLMDADDSGDEGDDVEMD